jgi:hypothetical protein
MTAFDPVTALLDLRFRLREALFGVRLGLPLGLGADLVGPLARLGDGVLPVRLGLRDDLVGLLLGLLDPFEDLWSRHTC